MDIFFQLTLHTTFSSYLQFPILWKEQKNIHCGNFK
jgi:hypothetical protein